MAAVEKVNEWELERVHLNERLLSALIGLARAVEGNEELITEETKCVLYQGLSKVLFDSDEGQEAGTDCDRAHQLTELLAGIREEKKRLVPNCFDCASPCGRTSDYDMQEFWEAEEERMKLRSVLVQRLVDRVREKKQQEFLSSGEESICFEALLVLGWNGSEASLLRMIKKMDKEG